MSKGPGRIERAIAAILDAEPDNAFTTEDLCKRIYKVEEVEKRHRVAVLRAAANVMKRRDVMRIWKSDTLGETKVYFDITNVMSYAMAAMKADFLFHYSNHNPNVWYTEGETEAELRAKVLPGGEWHDRVKKPNGAWYRHSQEAKAEIEAKRAGNNVKLKKLQAKHEEKSRKVMRKVIASFTAAVKKQRK
jgi:hypothetical protein